MPYKAVKGAVQIGCRRVELRPDVGVDPRRAGADLPRGGEQVDQLQHELDLEDLLLGRVLEQQPAVAAGPAQVLDVPAEQLAEDLVRIVGAGHEQRRETVRPGAGEVDEADDRVQVGQPVVGRARPAVLELLRERAVDPVIAAGVADVPLALCQVGAALEDERAVRAVLEVLLRQVAPVVPDGAGEAGVGELARDAGRVADVLVAREHVQLPGRGHEGRARAAGGELVADLAPGAVDRFRGTVADELLAAEQVGLPVGRAEGRVDAVGELGRQGRDDPVLGDERLERLGVAVVHTGVVGGRVPDVLVTGEQVDAPVGDQGRVDLAALHDGVARPADALERVVARDLRRDRVADPADDQVDGALVAEDRVDRRRSRASLKDSGRFANGSSSRRFADDLLGIAGIDRPVAATGVADVAVAGEEVGVLAPDEGGVDRAAVGDERVAGQAPPVTGGRRARRRCRRRSGSRCRRRRSTSRRRGR